MMQPALCERSVRFWAGAGPAIDSVPVPVAVCGTLTTWLEQCCPVTPCQDLMLQTVYITDYERPDSYPFDVTWTECCPQEPTPPAFAPSTCDDVVRVLMNARR